MNTIEQLRQNGYHPANPQNERIHAIMAERADGNSWDEILAALDRIMDDHQGLRALVVRDDVYEIRTVARWERAGYTMTDNTDMGE